MSAADASLFFSLAARGVASLVLAGALFLFHRRFPRNDIHRWALAFVSLGAFWVVASSLLVFGARWGVFNPARIGLTFLLAAAGYLAALLVAWGAWELALRRALRIRSAKVLFSICAGAAVATPLFLLALPDEVRFQLSLPITLHGLALAVAFAWSGQRVWRSRASVTSVGREMPSVSVNSSSTAP